MSDATRDRHRLFASCAPGLEPLLALEARMLGVAAEPQRGGVLFSGDTALLMRVALWSGVATHVLVRCAEFSCRALGELERKAGLLPWTSWLRTDVPLVVRASARRSRVYHTRAVEERIRTAAEHVLGTALPVASSEGDEGCVRVLVRFELDVCTISLDTTTTPLHRRGYRLATAKAPLREDLAHALVLASGWRPGSPLLDPFCGSGTVVVEAARLAAGLPPGHGRPPPLQHTALWSEEVWARLEKRRASAGSAPLFGSDRDAGAVAASRANAERAGVAELVVFEVHPLAGAPWLERPESAPASGVLATNPPFGLRVRGGQSMLNLYQMLGHRFTRLGKGWRLALLAADGRLARRTGVALRTAFATDHGGLPVQAFVSEPVLAPAGDPDSARSVPTSDTPL